MPFASLQPIFHATYVLGCTRKGDVEGSTTAVVVHTACLFCPRLQRRLVQVAGVNTLHAICSPRATSSLIAV
ncbi:hypothetical protein HanIR_Chr13g0632121 [Helianthus annuus]|nr:hypothetical protein HanIR_Chr13g0632121 [Helianthus annuus]